MSETGKNIAVVFDAVWGARIIKNPSNLSDLANRPGILINPDLFKVARTPPHFWKIVGNHVEIMTECERLKVSSTIDALDSQTSRHKVMFIPKSPTVPKLNDKPADSTKPKFGWFLPLVGSWLTPLFIYMVCHRFHFFE